MEINLAKYNYMAKTEPSFSCQVVYMTPDLAKELLATNVKNRSLRENHVQFLAQQMKAGLWKENGETIIIGADGVLQDSQHRLSACIKANYSFWVPIISNVDVNALPTIDTGKNRSLGDVLHMEGYPNAIALAALTKNVGTMNAYINKDTSVVQQSSGGGVQRKDKGYLTNKEGLAYVEQNKKDLYELLSESMKIYKRQPLKLLAATEIGAVIYMLGNRLMKKEFTYSQDHIEYMEEVVGVSNTGGTAPAWLFKKLAQSKADRRMVPWSFRIRAYIKCWNYFSEGNPKVVSMRVDLKKPLDKISG